MSELEYDCLTMYRREMFQLEVGEHNDDRSQRPKMGTNAARVLFQRISHLQHVHLDHDDCQTQVPHIAYPEG